MPIFRKLTMVAGAAEAARRYVRNNPEKINRWANRAGTFVDRRTKGKYHTKINTAVRKVHQVTNHRRSH
jgi:MT0933-like antitoxin protein